MVAEDMTGWEAVVEEVGVLREVSAQGVSQHST